MSGPMSPAEYGEGMSDEQLAEEGWAAGLDVWGPVEKAYANFVGDMTLANSQLWSLQCAIEARVRAELAAGPCCRAADESDGHAHDDGCRFLAGVRHARAEVAEEIALKIEAAKPSPRSFWGVGDAARVYALNDAAKIARLAAGSSRDATPRG